MTQKKVRSRRKEPMAPGTTIISIKMTKANRRRALQFAKKFAEGNLSAWVRHAAVAHTPKKGEKVSLKVA